MNPALVIVMLVACFSLGWFLCSRTQANRFDSAVTVSEIAKQSVTAAALAGRTYNDVVERAARLEAELIETRTTFNALIRAFDTLDKGQGAILNAMIHAGLLKGFEADRSAHRQRGEKDTAAPGAPPLTADPPAPR